MGKQNSQFGNSPCLPVKAKFTRHNGIVTKIDRDHSCTKEIAPLLLPLPLFSTFLFRSHKANDSTKQLGQPKRMRKYSTMITYRSAPQKNDVELQETGKADLWSDFGSQGEDICSIDLLIAMNRLS